VAEMGEVGEVKMDLEKGNEIIKVEGGELKRTDYRGEAFYNVRKKGGGGRKGLEGRT